ncbi:uncharacterized protein LOC144927271 [Branchiostoma floridae x Branchiostoma belcheri]
MSKVEVDQVPAEISHLRKLRVLLLNGNQFRELPKEICTLRKLERLGLSRNLVTKVAVEVKKLDNLTELSLNHNQFTEFPTQLPNHNQFTEFPTQVCYIPNLQLLTFDQSGGPGVQALPDEISELQHVTELVLDNNNIMVLPTVMGSMSNLLHLSLANNQLMFVPESLCELPQLRSLQLQGNQLQRLPNNFGHLAKEVDLNLTGNPLTRPPTVVCDGGKVTPIGRYLRKAEQRDELLLQKMVQCVQSSITTKDVYTTVLPKLRLPKDALEVLAGMGRHAPIPDKLRVALARWRDLQPTPAAGTERLIRIFDVLDIQDILNKLKTMKIRAQQHRL